LNIKPLKSLQAAAFDIGTPVEPVFCLLEESRIQTTHFKNPGHVPKSFQNGLAQSDKK
jgi:hypothetical protein